MNHSPTLSRCKENMWPLHKRPCVRWGRWRKAAVITGMGSAHPPVSVLSSGERDGIQKLSPCVLLPLSALFISIKISKGPMEASGKHLLKIWPLPANSLMYFKYNFKFSFKIRLAPVIDLCDHALPVVFRLCHFLRVNIFLTHLYTTNFIYWFNVFLPSG